MSTILRKGNACFFSFLCVLFFLHNSFSFSQFANYQSTICVNDIICSGSQTWAASSGGLFVCDLGKNTGTLYNDINQFPDVNLTALCKDAKGNLWIGSKLGYLYKQTPDGRSITFNPYYGSQWEIQALYAYKDYILVGSTKGFSIFDPGKGQALVNASIFDTINNPSVFSITVHNDSLYLGCTGGFACINIVGGKFLSNNYPDPSLWRSGGLGGNVVSFIDSSDVLLPQIAPTVLAGQTFFRGLNLGKDGDTSVFKNNDNVICRFPSAIKKITADDKGNIWIGNAENYLNVWNGTSIISIKIPGLTFNIINRVFAAKNGTVWLEPITTVSNPELWYWGITSFNGKTWTFYNQLNTPNLGPIGGSGGDTKFHGLCEDRDGNLWFGCPGGGIKKFNSEGVFLSRYFMAGYDPFGSNIIEINDPINVDPPFEKCDAIAQDSSSFLWFANWGKEVINPKGSLICTDPLVKNCSRFFPVGDPNYIHDIISLCVDTRGNILAGGDAGELLIFTPNSNPLQNGVDKVSLFRTNFLKVYDICATSNGISWIATQIGLYKYNSNNNTIDSIPTAKIPAPIISVKAESDDVIWLGTSTDGLIRYTVSDSSKNIVNMTNGLVSNKVKDLSIDKKGGYLWIAADGGLSRMSLGHTFTAINDNKSIYAYPNPYSLTNPNHKEIIFKHLAPNAKVYIYTLRGALVKTLSRDGDNAIPGDNNPFETTLRWVPSKKLVPGTYYFVGQPQMPAKTQKILIVP